MAPLTPVGCDVSKSTIDIGFFINDSAFQHIKVSNNALGFQKAKAFFDKWQINPHICMEATGVYYEGLADYMSHAGYRVSVLNPLKIKNFARTEFLRTKTDKQDSKLIARYAEKMRPAFVYIKPDEQQYQIKRGIAYIRQLNQDLNAVKNRIAASKDNFVTAMLNEQLLEIKNRIEKVKNHLSELSEQSDIEKSVNHLQTIPSIGRQTAIVLAHFMQMYQFQTENKFIAFAGLSPQKEESGESYKKRDRLSNYGNRLLKGSLYMSALVCMRFGYFGKFIARLKAKRKPNKVILVALMRKLAGIAWHLWQRGQDFNSARYGMSQESLPAVR